ncbi:MAG: hypothetical protein ACLR78_14105 [Roseburia sp.]
MIDEAIRLENMSEIEQKLDKLNANAANEIKKAVNETARKTKKNSQKVPGDGIRQSARNIRMQCKSEALRLAILQQRLPQAHRRYRWLMAALTGQKQTLKCPWERKPQRYKS